MPAQLRTRFLRDMLRAVERDQGAGALERLRDRLPDRLRVNADPQALNASTASDAISLDDGEELLLAVDASLGDGSGRLLEGAAFDLVSRTVSQGGGMLVVGDLAATVARMRAPLEWPFVGVTLMFDLVPTDTGFALTIGIPGRPRSARLLRSVAAGTIRAAQRYCREADVDEMKLVAEVFGDRANISARYRAPREPSNTEMPPTRSKRTTARNVRRVTGPTLADEVERILSVPPAAPTPEPPSVRPERPRTAPDGPVRRVSSSFPPVRPGSDKPPKD